MTPRQKARLKLRVFLVFAVILLSVAIYKRLNDPRPFRFLPDSIWLPQPMKGEG
jgi:hypothetical protein